MVGFTIKEKFKINAGALGSVSSWIEKNIVSSTLFLGRPSYIKIA